MKNLSYIQNNTLLLPIFFLYNAFLSMMIYKSMKMKTHIFIVIFLLFLKAKHTFLPIYRVFEIQDPLLYLGTFCHCL